MEINLARNIWFRKVTLAWPNVIIPWMFGGEGINIYATNKIRFWIYIIKCWPNFHVDLFFNRIRDSSVRITTGYGIDGQGSILSRARFFHHSVQTGSVAHPPPYPMGTAGSFSPGVKRPGCEADHSPPSSTEVKNGGAIPPLLHVFMA
jgi:hypothetical protein